MAMRFAACLVLFFALIGCQPASDEPPPLTREQLLNPESCKDCHPKYYREWSGSMHAYAMKDPVFIAMNKRGQEETGGALGDFCVKCHAPMAVKEKAISNFADLTAVPEHLQGVTCYFCHNAVSIGDQHFNGNIDLANDTTMRANLRKPLEPTAHGVARSDFHDGNNIKSSLMCGTCHDIVTPAPNNVHLERTLAEYLPSFVAQQNASFQSCQSCHMRSETEQVAVSTGREGEVTGSRDAHEHLWAAVDVPLTDFPHAAAMRSAVEECELKNSIAYLTLARDGANPIGFKMNVETQAGHNQPSGATQDRRLWVEVVGYDANNNQVFSSGVVADGALEGLPGKHPCMFRDVARDASGAEVHMFWEVAREPTGPDSNLLPVGTKPGVPHGLQCGFQTTQPVVRFVATMRMRPIGVDVLQSLVTSGHLDPTIPAKMPTLTVTTREFVLDPKVNDFVESKVSRSDCKTYKACLLDPSAPECHLSTTL